MKLISVEEDIDFVAGHVNPIFTFGPCYPYCYPEDLERISQIHIEDDDDLEFDHGFSIGFDPDCVSPPGIILETPVDIYIVDDGVCIYLQ